MEGLSHQVAPLIPGGEQYAIQPSTDCMCTITHGMTVATQLPH